MFQNLHTTSNSFAPFPNGNNVRVTIAGLAICRFNSDTTKPSLFHFLDHVPLHELRITVKRKAINSTKIEIVFPEQVIPKNSGDIVVFGSIMDNQPNYQHNPQKGEYPLSEIINLSELHNTRFKRNTSKTTDLSLSHCSFYTKQITSDDYYVIANGLPTTVSPQKLGETLGAYMNASGTINITIGGKQLYQGLIFDQAINYEYEIEFTNHCQASTPDCQAVIDSDMKFLYDRIKPTKNDLMKIKLLKVTFNPRTKVVIMTPNVAACLLGATEPCASCT